jgi:uncharacterized protein YoxC
VSGHTTSINTNTANIATNTSNIATNASAITTLNGTVSTLSTTVSGHTTSINTLTGDVADNTADIATNTSAITTLNGSVATLSTTVSAHTTSINTNTANIATNTADIVDNTADIATNASAITTLNGTVSTLSTTVSGHTTSINTLTGDVADNTADIATNASAITTLSGTVSTLSTTVSGHTTSINTLTGDVADNTADIATNTSAITTLSGSVSTLSTTVSAHTTSINTLTGDVADNTADIATNASAISTLSGSVATLSSTVSSHTSSISTLTGDVATNTANITTNTTAITTLNGYAAAKYSVTLDVNGYATGFSLFNGGTSFSTATFIVDYFRVAKPGTGGGAAIPVFEIATVNGSASIAIKGTLISDGSIIARSIAARTITADKVVVGTLTAEEASGAAFTSMSDTIGATVGPGLRYKDLIVSLAYTPSALASGNMMFSFDGEQDCKKLDNNPASSTWLEMWIDGACTISNGGGSAAAVITYNAHGLVVDQQVRFTTTGALPTGLVVGTNYFVKTVSNANQFTVCNAIGNPAQITSSAGSGTHKCNARYAQRRCVTNFISSGENNIREGVTWMRRMTVSAGVSHTFSVLVGDGDNSGAFLDFGTDRYNMKVPAIILLESKR